MTIYRIRQTYKKQYFFLFSIHNSQILNYKKIIILFFHNTRKNDTQLYKNIFNDILFI